MMLTFRAGKVAALTVCLSLAACSREQQDWRTAEAADTVESYDQFLEHHPDSELVTAARTRVAQLTEDREWQQAGSADTPDAYREFLAHHPNGKWAQEARIRIQNFALNGLSAQGAPDSGPAASVAPGTGAATTAPIASTAAAGAGLAPPVGPASVPGIATATAATPTQSVPLPIPTTTPPAGYGVQLGAFTSETAANTAWQQLTARFGAELRGLAPHLVPANTTSGTLFRLQAQVPDESRARALCDRLRQQSQACVPVLPH